MFLSCSRGDVTCFADSHLNRTAFHIKIVARASALPGGILSAPIRKVHGRSAPPQKQTAVLEFMTYDPRSCLPFMLQAAWDHCLVARLQGWDHMPMSATPLFRCTHRRLQAARTLSSQSSPAGGQQQVPKLPHLPPPPSDGSSSPPECQKRHGMWTLGRGFLALRGGFLSPDDHTRALALLVEDACAATTVEARQAIFAEVAPAIAAFRYLRAACFKDTTLFNMALDDIFHTAHHALSLTRLQYVVTLMLFLSALLFRSEGFPARLRLIDIPPPHSPPELFALMQPYALLYLHSHGFPDITNLIYDSDVLTEGLREVLAGDRPLVSTSPRPGAPCARSSAVPGALVPTNTCATADKAASQPAVVAELGAKPRAVFVERLRDTDTHAAEATSGKPEVTLRFEPTEQQRFFLQRPVVWRAASPRENPYLAVAVRQANEAPPTSLVDLVHTMASATSASPAAADAAVLSQQAPSETTAVTAPPQLLASTAALAGSLVPPRLQWAPAGTLRPCIGPPALPQLASSRMSAAEMLSRLRTHTPRGFTGADTRSGEPATSPPYLPPLLRIASPRELCPLAGPVTVAPPDEIGRVTHIDAGGGGGGGSSSVGASRSLLSIIAGTWHSSTTPPSSSASDTHPTQMPTTASAASGNSTTADNGTVVMRNPFDALPHALVHELAVAPPAPPHPGNLSLFIPTAARLSPPAPPPAPPRSPPTPPAPSPTSQSFNRSGSIQCTAGDTRSNTSAPTGITSVGGSATRTAVGSDDPITSGDEAGDTVAAFHSTAPPPPLALPLRYGLVPSASHAESAQSTDDAQAHVHSAECDNSNELLWPLADRGEQLPDHIALRALWCVPRAERDSGKERQTDSAAVARVPAADEPRPMQQPPPPPLPPPVASEPGAPVRSNEQPPARKARRKARRKHAAEVPRTAEQRGHAPVMGCKDSACLDGAQWQDCSNGAVKEVGGAFEILSSLTALPVAAMLAEDVRPEAEPPSLASFPSPRLAASPPPPQLSPATPDGARVAAAARPAATPFTVMSVAERASRGSRDDSENSGGVANGASGGSGPYRAGSANGDAQSTAAAVVAGPSSQFAQLATPRYAARSHAHHVPVLHALRLPYHIPSRHERQEAYRERLAQLGGEAEASLDDPLIDEALGTILDCTSRCLWEFECIYKQAGLRLCPTLPRSLARALAGAALARSVALLVRLSRMHKATAPRAQPAPAATVSPAEAPMASVPPSSVIEAAAAAAEAGGIANLAPPPGTSSLGHGTLPPDDSNARRVSSAAASNQNASNAPSKDPQRRGALQQPALFGTDSPTESQTALAIFFQAWTIDLLCASDPRIRDHIVSLHSPDLRYVVPKLLPCLRSDDLPSSPGRVPDPTTHLRLFARAVLESLCQSQHGSG